MKHLLLISFKMGTTQPKLPKIPVDRSSHDKSNNLKVIFPDEENINLEHHDDLEQYYVAYSTITFQIKDLVKYEIDEETYRSCEEQRGNIHYFKMKNILESFDGEEIFVKVFNFSPDLLKLSENDAVRVKGIKSNKRLLKEYLILDHCQARFISKPLGYFNNKESQKIYLMYEFVNKRFHDLLKEQSLGPFLNRLRLVKNIIDIIIYLHTNGIISLDISPFSIGVTGEKHETKILTFGNSIKLTGEAYDVLRESWFDRSLFDFFTAPEIYLNKSNLLRYIWSADIWSLGILFYIMFRDDYSQFYLKLDETFADKEHEIYTDDREYVAEKFFEIFDMNQIKNPLIKALITSMVKMDFIERPNIFEVADNYNKICRILELEESYEVVYKRQDVFAFTKVYDKATYDLIADKRDEK